MQLKAQGCVLEIQGWSHKFGIRLSSETRRLTDELDV